MNNYREQGGRVPDIQQSKVGFGTESQASQVPLGDLDQKRQKKAAIAGVVILGGSIAVGALGLALGGKPYIEKIFDAARTEHSTSVPTSNGIMAH